MTNEQSGEEEDEEEQSGEEEDEEVEFVRRNISLPPSFADKVDELAEQHYGGNVSHLFRASVSDHERTLNEQGLLALDLIRSELSTNTERTNDILDILNELLEESQQIEAQLDYGESLEVSHNNQDAEAHAWEIRSYFEDTDSPASSNTLTRELELSQKEVRDGIEVLLDLGIVEPVDGDRDNSRYRQTTTTPNTSTKK